MGSKGDKNPRKPHRATVETTRMLAANAAHLARALKRPPYPGLG